MLYDNALVAGKLRRWGKYLEHFRLPKWEDIPDIGYYMEQVITLLKQYIDYLPPELKEEQFITPATINNYVRMKVMPEPKKKKYYRVHIAYLIVILTLKQSLSIALIQKIMPMDKEEDEVKRIYGAYAERHEVAARYFTEQVRLAGAIILEHEETSVLTTARAGELVATSAVISGFARLLAEKLLLLDGKNLENGGSIEERMYGED